MLVNVLFSDEKLLATTALEWTPSFKVPSLSSAPHLTTIVMGVNPVHQFLLSLAGLIKVQMGLIKSHVNVIPLFITPT